MSDTPTTSERRRSGRIKRDELLRDIRTGFARTQKELSPKYFYDERGSELFEEITRLPEYYPTEAERNLLRECAPEFVRATRLSTLVELGAGSANKTRVILDAMRDSGFGRMYIPVDVSGDFLDQVAAQLRREYPMLEILPAVADITADFQLPPTYPPTVIAFLGSTIGNFGREETISLLSRCAQLLGPDDRFLLGCDLRKSTAKLEAAYNDSRGVTAEFNLNMLRVINNELGAHFDTDAFRHRAFYNEDLHRIEMHLVSTKPQTIMIPGIGNVDFAEGESIHTEVSYKYNRSAIEELFIPSGLVLDQWMTDKDENFALAVGRAQQQG
jgi:L-histidine N-alpha-methyltransferase